VFDEGFDDLGPELAWAVVPRAGKRQESRSGHQLGRAPLGPVGVSSKPWITGVGTRSSRSARPAAEVGGHLALAVRSRYESASRSGDREERPGRAERQATGAAGSLVLEVLPWCKGLSDGA
jgi:hypothetical protein